MLVKVLEQKEPVGFHAAHLRQHLDGFELG
jgi:hypothetical protein